MLIMYVCCGGTTTLIRWTTKITMLFYAGHVNNFLIKAGISDKTFSKLVVHPVQPNFVILLERTPIVGPAFITAFSEGG